jgi:hypothetical protein
VSGRARCLLNFESIVHTQIDPIAKPSFKVFETSCGSAQRGLDGPSVDVRSDNTSTNN